MWGLLRRIVDAAFKNGRLFWEQNSSVGVSAARGYPSLHTFLYPPVCSRKNQKAVIFFNFQKKIIQKRKSEINPNMQRTAHTSMKLPDSVLILMFWIECTIQIFVIRSAKKVVAGSLNTVGDQEIGTLKLRKIIHDQETQHYSIPHNRSHDMHITLLEYSVSEFMEHVNVC